MEKELIIWQNHKLEDIPSQDNPQTYMDKSIMICLSSRAGKYSVYDIIETGAHKNALKRAQVYDYEIAVRMAQALR